MAKTQRTVELNSIRPNTTFLVRGKLAYSRLVNKIEGQALQDDIRSRRQRGIHPIDKPYTTATINDAVVVVKDPNNLAPQEIYAQESFYASRAEGASGYSYSAVNKGNQTPWIGEEVSPGNIVQVYPDGELANGLEVTLVLRVFGTKTVNNGLSLDGVIVHEPIRTFASNRTQEILGDHGYTFTATEAPKPVKEDSYEDDPNMVMHDNPQDPRIAQPQYVQPQAQPQQAQPMQPPVHQSAPVQTQGQMPPNPLGQAQSAPQQAQGQQQPDPNQSGGIRYSPEDRY